MSKKIILMVSAVVLALCGVACVSTYIIGRHVVSKTIASQPEQAAQVGREIADYVLPPAYREVVGMSLFGAKSVVIGSDAPGALVIMLMQYPGSAEISHEDMQRQMARSLEQQGQSGTSQFQVVGVQRAIIKGQEVILTISEGKNESATVRQVVGVFPGKAGPVMLMVMGNVATWDQAALDAFLASIR